MRTDDRQVEEFLAKFTLLPMDEVRAIAAARRAPGGGRPGRLAEESARARDEATAAAAAATTVLFGGSPLEAGPEALAVVAAEVPTAPLPGRDELAAGADLVPLLVEAGLASSKGEARRAIDQGGVSVNGRRVGPGAAVRTEDVLHGRYVLLRKGKKHYAMLVGA